MHIDTFLEIGNQHKVCEDYIISGHDPMPYIILADGCSSSNNSEMGARILCYLARQYLKYKGTRDLSLLDYHYSKRMSLWIIHNAEMIARQLGLSLSSLDATLVIAYQFDNNIHIHMYGDGCIFSRSLDGTTRLMTIEYTQNSPYYLTYLTDSERQALYSKMLIDKTVVINNSEEKEQTIKLPNYEEFLYSFDLDIYSLILISSDGISSFIKPEENKTELILPQTVIDSCIAFKTMNGDFLKRRMNRQMKTFLAEGINHYDDLSVGVFIQED
jgi:serine/threonine protein phosphatase PrpC